jgi:hypothetical protein
MRISIDCRLQAFKSIDCRPSQDLDTSCEFPNGTSTGTVWHTLCASMHPTLRPPAHPATSLCSWRPLRAPRQQRPSASAKGHHCSRRVQPSRHPRQYAALPSLPCASSPLLLLPLPPPQSAREPLGPGSAHRRRSSSVQREEVRTWIFSWGGGYIQYDVAISYRSVLVLLSVDESRALYEL